MLVNLHQRYQDKYGSSARIQLNDKFASVDEVGAFILAERASKRQELQNVLTTAYKLTVTPNGINSRHKTRASKSSGTENKLYD